jgi:YVTN family beta-propeller protein
MKLIISFLTKIKAITLTSTLARLAFALLACLSLISCKKEPDDEEINNPLLPLKSEAVYILNQGSFSGNNASVTMINLTNDSITTDYFSTQNNRELGDTGADLYIYGGKAYIITNVSSQLEVVNSVTFKSIKQIPFFQNGIPQQPSAITGYEANVYVTSYDGTVTVIDTATLEIKKVIVVGLNPDAIIASNGLIWVSNSGGLNFPNYDNTISVIDPVTLSETDKIVIGTNPYTLQADAYGDIYVITRGNYGSEKMRLRVIDSSTKSVKYTFEDFEAYNFTIEGDTAYVYHYDYMGSNGSSIMMINVKTEQLITSSFITDGTTVETVYGIATDPSSDDVYISDAKGYQGNGVVFRFTNEGKLKSTFNVGINPVAIRFLLK